MKLSKAQVKAIESAKKDIDFARAFDSFEEYLVEADGWYKRQGGVDYVRKHINDHAVVYYKECWEREKNGIVLSRAGKNTIEALVRMGIFTVIGYDPLRRQGVLDWVKLNNY